MSIYTWLRSRDASIAELTAQRDAARAAVDAALAAVAPAQHSFDDTGDDAAAKTLRKTREAAQHAQEHFDRAERLLSAAKQREAEAARVAAQARVAALDEQLSHAAVLAAAQPLDEREVTLLRQLAELRAARLELADQFAALSAERFSLLIAAGHSPDRLGSNEFARRGTLLSADRIVTALRTELATHEYRSPMYTTLVAIIDSLGGSTQPLRAIGGAA